MEKCWSSVEQKNMLMWKKTFNSSDVQTPKKREVDPSNLGELPRMLGQPGYTRHIWTNMRQQKMEMGFSEMW